MRWVTFAVFHLLLAVLATVLLFSWVVRCALGRPLNGDAARVLFDSPLASILHIRESDPALLAFLACGLALFVWICGRMLVYSSHAWVGARSSLRALLVVLCVSLGGLSSWRIANASLTRSSYASVFLPEGYDQTPMVYSCPDAPQVPIGPRVEGTGNGSPVIVVILESMRGDFLRAHPEAVPFLSSLARESVVFDKAYSTATHSDFADISIWYSRYALYGDLRKGYPRNAAWRGTSVFEYFGQHGYSTGYFSSQNERWGEMINWMMLPELDAFFDAHNFIDPDLQEDDTSRFMKDLRPSLSQSGKVPDDYTLQLAGDWVQRHRDEPFMLGINLQNTHFAYLTPPGAQEPFQPADRSVRDIVFSWPAERADAIRNRYHNAVFNVDSALARFARRLQDAGIWDKATVLILGDHGEAFREHGYATHSGPPFDEMARIFALMKLPKGSERNGTVFPDPVSNIDFIPTLVQLAGMPEWPGFQGRPLFDAAAPSPVFMTVNGLTRENAVLEWPWKLMSRTFPERQIELYNLVADAGEVRNVVSENPEIAFRLAKRVEDWRTCQITYYGDRMTHKAYHPPRF